MQIGGKPKKTHKASQPQFVVQKAGHVNEFVLFGVDEKQRPTMAWVGDPNAATKFNSKYEAKCRIRDIDDVPASRCIRPLAGGLS